MLQLEVGYLLVVAAVVVGVFVFLAVAVAVLVRVFACAVVFVRVAVFLCVCLVSRLVLRVGILIFSHDMVDSHSCTGRPA